MAVVDHVVPDHLVGAVALRIAAGDRAAARGRADGGSDVEVCRAHALGGHAVEVRRDELRRSEAREVEALIVADNIHEVGRASGGGQGRRDREQEKGEAKEDVHGKVNYR